MKIIRKSVRVLILIALFLALLVFINRAVVVGTTADFERNMTDIAEEAAWVSLGSSEDYDAIIVLGAGVDRDRNPSPILKSRLDKALEIWKTGIARTILVTGDHRPGEYDEVDVMWEYLVVAGVPEEKIVRDYAGFSTYESMYRTANEFQIHRGIVVTQQYHLYRSMYIAQSFDAEVIGVAAENKGNFIGRLYRTIREVAACIKDVQYSYQKKEV